MNSLVVHRPIVFYTYSDLVTDGRLVLWWAVDRKHRANLQNRMALLNVATFYWLQSLDFAAVFLDIDECRLRKRRCSQVCNNTPGSFTCSCRPGYELIDQRTCTGVNVLFCSLAVLDPRVGHTMDVLSPFIPVLCHSDWLFYGESCPCLHSP